MSLNSDYQKLEPGNTVRLFEVDGTAFGTGEVLRFHNYNLAYTEDEIAAANPLSPINLIETTLDNRVAFQRAGAASYIGQDGKIYQAAANQWPLELGGRTEPEPASTNLLTYSNAWANAAWLKSNGSAVSNAVTAPDGTQNGTKWIPNTVNNTHPIYRSFIPSPNTDYSFSVFIKDAGYGFATISIVQASNLVQQNLVTVDLNAGVILRATDMTRCSIIKLADGWVRVTVTSTTAATISGDIRPAVYPMATSSTTLMTGDGVKGIAVWGAHFEQNSAPTSLIYTSGTIQTRPAATAVIPANGASGVKITYSTGETASLSFGSAGSIALPAATKPWGTRYITKIEYIGGTPVYDESKLPAKSIWWQGNEYSAWPVQIEGIEASTSGSGAQPKLTVANLDGSITALCLAYDDMLQAVVTIHDTLAQYLDARNFAGGNATADATQEKLQVFYIDSKSMETNISVEFTLSSPMDLQGLMIPTRQLHSLCTWCIRGKYRSGDGCDYAGTNYFDKHGNPVSDPSLDVCNGTLNTGCKLRFGANNELPFGGFPGTSLIKS
ncbi:phage minor tail protein L (plasmid) [Rahnella aceris]|uniref:Phage minor tail protein L n=2 Tax=Rahnella TaxID=34037 RepID=A0A0H3FM24_RAHSY|nr:phage minor tail protein L [Rahnella aceris]